MSVKSPSLNQSVEVKNYPVMVVSPTALPVGVPPVQVGKGKKFGWKAIAVASLAVLFVGGGSVGATQWVSYLSTHQDTDDAYVTGHLHQISSRINGTVEKVLIDDNQHVKAGQLIAVLDPRDFQVKVNQAKASLKNAERQANAAYSSIALASSTATGQQTNAQGSVADSIATISKSEAAVTEALTQIEQSKSDLVGKQAEADRAQLDFQRYQELADDHAVSRQEADNAKRDFIIASKARDIAKDQINQSNSKYEQAIQSVKKAKAQLLQSQGQIELANASKVQTEVNTRQFEVAKSAIDEAKASLQEAELNLSYTVITAPTSGRIGKKAVEVGQRVEPGQPLVTLVSDDLWVVANFKETQLSNMRPNQIVEIKVDSFPGHKFIGHVDSITPGSGSSFAVLPSDNATGNFTKIVQRVPVKIVFDKASLGQFSNLLVPGMSVVAEVEVAHKKA